MSARARGCWCVPASILLLVCGDAAGGPAKPPPAPLGQGAAAYTQHGPAPPRKEAGARIAAPVFVPAATPAASTSSSPRAASGSSAGDVDGPVALSVAKSWNGSSWDLVLNWSGHTGGVTVVTSPHPSFESSVTTLEKEFAPSTLTVAARSSRTLECFDVTDAATASRAVQGYGYDPDPPPTTPTAVLLPTGTLHLSDVWWGDTVRVTSGYLDPIPAANVMGMQNRLVKAVEVQGWTGGAFARSADFVVPEDARSHWMVPMSNGQGARGGDFMSLYPKGPGMPSFSHLRSIVWAPQTGHVWVADDTSLRSIDLFLSQPQEVFVFLDVVRPHLSQVTEDGKILYVDGNLGAAKVWQIDVVTGNRTEYANTTDDEFTRPILAAGIAVRPDRSDCYVADASAGDGAGRIVQLSRDNDMPIRDDYGQWPYWSFTDPVGMDVGLDGTLFVGAANDWIGEIPDATHTWWYADTNAPARTILVDREVSTPAAGRFWWSEFAGWALAHNLNDLAGSGGQRRYVGALLVHEGNDKINVAPQWQHMPDTDFVVWPARVILDRQNKLHDWLWPYQSTDRVVKLVVRGWYGVPLHLRLIDPPDLSPYAPVDGFAPRGGKPAVPPYEANDNRVWDNATYVDFGLTTSEFGTLDPGEPWPVLQLDVMPGPDHTATFYVKLPVRYAGDNWQVEVTKMTPSLNVLTNRVAGFSQVITGWKRWHFERERMFRGGGLLSRSASPGEGHVFVAKYQDGGGNWVRADTLAVGDRIAVFDSARPADDAGHDVACVRAIDPSGATEVDVTLGQELSCTTPYSLKYAYSSSVDPVTHEWTFADGTRSAGVGVLRDCSTAPNLVNSPSSCFRTFDLGVLEGTYRDGYVHALAPEAGMGVLPYIPRVWFDENSSAYYARLSKLWFENFEPLPADPLKASPHNYFHAIAASDNTAYKGWTHPLYDYSFVFVGGIERLGRPPDETTQHIRATCVHEIAHLSDVNPDTCDSHDARNAWCSSEAPCLNDLCIMNDEASNFGPVHELCRQDLWDGTPSGGTVYCDGNPQTWTAGRGAVRTEEDPK